VHVSIPRTPPNGEMIMFSSSQSSPLSHVPVGLRFKTWCAHVGHSVRFCWFCFVRLFVVVVFIKINTVTVNRAEAGHTFFRYRRQRPITACREHTHDGVVVFAVAVAGTAISKSQGCGCSTGSGGGTGIALFRHGILYSDDSLHVHQRQRRR